MTEKVTLYLADKIRYALYQKISELKAKHPFINKILNASGFISEDIPDCISYLKKVGVL